MILYLAQVQKPDNLGIEELRLLARKQADNTWAVIASQEVVAIANNNNTDNPANHLFLTEGLLVLVELSDSHQILSIQEATNWVLNLVQNYLKCGITPEFLQQEAERCEQWRQELTIQTQELVRKTLESETRREELQALEENLKRKEQELGT